MEREEVETKTPLYNKSSKLAKDEGCAPIKINLKKENEHRIPHLCLYLSLSLFLSTSKFLKKKTFKNFSKTKML